MTFGASGAVAWGYRWPRCFHMVLGPVVVVGAAVVVVGAMGLVLVGAMGLVLVLMLVSGLVLVVGVVSHVVDDDVIYGGCELLLVRVR